MKNKIQQMIIGVLALACIVLALELRSSHYELTQVRKANADWFGYADWSMANHKSVTGALQAKIDAMQKTNTLLTNK
jgi:hypothetical protein